MAQLRCIGLSWPLTNPPFGSCAIYFHYGVGEWCYFILTKIPFSSILGCQGTSDSTAAWVKIAFRLDNSGAFIPPQNGWLQLASHLTSAAAKRQRTHVDCVTNIQNNKHHLSPIIMHLHRSSSHHHQHQPNQPSKSAVILEMPQLIQLIVWIQKYTRQSQNLWQPPLEPESSTWILWKPPYISPSHEGAPFLLKWIYLTIIALNTNIG